MVKKHDFSVQFEKTLDFGLSFRRPFFLLYAQDIGLSVMEGGWSMRSIFPTKRSLHIKSKTPNMPGTKNLWSVVVAVVQTSSTVGLYV